MANADVITVSYHSSSPSWTARSLLAALVDPQNAADRAQEMKNRRHFLKGKTNLLRLLKVFAFLLCYPLVRLL